MPFFSFISYFDEPTSETRTPWCTVHFISFDFRYKWSMFILFSSPGCIWINTSVLGIYLLHNVNSIINCEFQYSLVEGNLILEKIKECQKSSPLIEASVPMPKGVPCWHVLLQRGEGGEVKVASNYRIFHQWSSNLVAVQSVSLHLRWHGLLKIKLN